MSLRTEHVCRENQARTEATRHSQEGDHAKLENTAFYTNVATRTVRTVTSPLHKLGTFKAGEIAPAGWGGARLGLVADSRFWLIQDGAAGSADRHQSDAVVVVRGGWLMRVNSGLNRPMRGSIQMEVIDLVATPSLRIVELGIAHMPENRHPVEDNLGMGGFIPQ